MIANILTSVATSLIMTIVFLSLSSTGGIGGTVETLVQTAPGVIIGGETSGRGAGMLVSKMLTGTCCVSACKIDPLGGLSASNFDPPC